MREEVARCTYLYLRGLSVAVYDLHPSTAANRQRSCSSPNCLISIVKSQTFHFRQQLTEPSPSLLLSNYLYLSQMVDNKVNKFRHVILEILHRLPNNEVLKPHVQELLLLVMTVVDTDNEDNAIQGLRVVFDLQKNYRPQLESEVPRFLQVG